MKLTFQTSFALVILSSVLVKCKRDDSRIVGLEAEVRDLSETVATLRKELKETVVKVSQQDGVIAQLRNKEATVKEDKCSQTHGWWRFDQSCYWFSPKGKQVTYDTARTVCQAKGKGADLALINSEEEGEFIARVADFTVVDSAWWLGCQYNLTIKDFLCVNGEVMGYRKWSDGRPTGYLNARCLQIWHPPKTEMTDTQCNQRWSFVCERPLRRPMPDHNSVGSP